MRRVLIIAQHLLQPMHKIHKNILRDLKRRIFRHFRTARTRGITLAAAAEGGTRLDEISVRRRLES